MGNSISPLAWTLIILFGVFIVAINISLFVSLKKNQNKDSWIDRLTSTGRKVRDPFRDENEKFHELSLKVEKFRHNNPNTGNENGIVSDTGAKNEH